MVPLHLQSLAPTNPHWARVVGYGPFSLCVIHKEGQCPTDGGINRLLMMMNGLTWYEHATRREENRVTRRVTNMNVER
jgi:hypothetical protein